MRINNHTIEIWADVQYAVRDEDFTFLHLWEQRDELISIAQSSHFFSNDTEIGFSATSKQLVFNYAASQWMQNKTNPTSVLMLKKTAQGYIFIVKHFEDESRLTTVCSIDINVHRFPRLYQFLSSVDITDGKMTSNRLVAVTGLLLLLSDGIDTHLRACDKWITDNEQDIRYAMGLVSVARDDDFVISVYSNSHSLSSISEPKFPLRPRVIENKSGEKLVINHGNEQYILQPDECVVGIFHDNDCYCLLPNKGKCPISQVILSIRWDRGKHQTYLKASDLEEPVDNVISFLCGDRGYCYVCRDGKVYCDSSQFFELKCDIDALSDEDGQVLCISMPDEDTYRIITTNKLIEL